MPAAEIAYTLSPTECPHERESSLSNCPPTLLITMRNRQLIEFLLTEMAIPAESIALGLRCTTEVPSLLPMVLWQYGLVTTQQLDQIFEWLETCPTTFIS